MSSCTLPWWSGKTLQDSGFEQRLLLEQSSDVGCSVEVCTTSEPNTSAANGVHACCCMLLRWLRVLRTSQPCSSQACATVLLRRVQAVCVAGHARVSRLLRARCDPLFCGQSTMSWTGGCRQYALAMCRPIWALRVAVSLPATFSASAVCHCDCAHGTADLPGWGGTAASKLLTQVPTDLHSAAAPLQGSAQRCWPQEAGSRLRSWRAVRPVSRAEPVRGDVTAEDRATGCVTCEACCTNLQEPCTARLHAVC